MLGGHTLDFVVVCVPHRYHLDCITTISNWGIPVLKEKPVAESREEFLQLLSLPVKVGVAFQKRFGPRFTQFEKLLSQVGEIASFRATLALTIEDLERTWRATDGVGVTVGFFSPSVLFFSF